VVREPAHLPPEPPLRLRPAHHHGAYGNRCRGRAVRGVTLAFGTVSGLGRSGSRLNAFLRTVLMAVMAMTAAVMARPALFRSAPGPPDIHHLRNRNGIGSCCGSGTRIRRCNVTRCDGLCRCFSGGLNLRRFLALELLSQELPTLQLRLKPRDPAALRSH